MKRLQLIAFILAQLFNGIVSEMYNSSYWLGTPVHLECGAQDRVDCSWRYNGRTMGIGQRYRYLFSNGSATIDCSIAIGLFHEEDVGNWTCWSLSNDNYEGELLATYTLNIKLKQRSGFMRASPYNVATQIGWFVSIPCKFNIFLEECHWLRNGQPVDIVNRYTYVNYLASGSDCSMNITSVQNIDIGNWQCATSTNNAYGYVISKIGQVTVQGKNGSGTDIAKVGNNNTLLEHPENSTVRIGDTHDMRCKFLEPVKCVWLRKEQAIHVGYRYSYISKEGNASKKADCSLRISNSQMIDQGQWRCVGAGDDRYPAIQSDQVFISLVRDEVTAGIIVPPDDIIAEFGKNITLICKFNSSINCDWSRDGLSVKINGRYNYTTAERGKNTTDCSIKIQSVSEVDVGNWSCANMLNYTKTYVESAHVILSLLKAPYPVKIMLGNTELKPMVFSHLQSSSEVDALELTCISEMGNPPPGLAWQANEGVVLPGSYKYELVGKYLYTATLKSKLVDLPRERLIQLICNVDFPNLKDSLTTFLYIGVTESKDLELVEGPANAVIPLKDPFPMNLTCKFNKPVQCNWEHNSTIISGEQGYKYADGSKGITTMDCTITINTTLDMMGRWQCFSQATPVSGHLGSAKILLSLMRKPTLPVIRYYGNRIVNSSVIVHPNLSRIYLYCNSRDGNPTPSLRWEFDGKPFKQATTSLQYDSARNQHSNEISVEVDRHLLVKNSTSMKCVMEHPSYPEPQTVEVLLMRNKMPIDPIISINDTLVKTNIEVLTNSSTEIRCVSQAGNPPAKMFWEFDGHKISAYEETLSSDNGLFTVILHWTNHFNWAIFTKSTATLKCMAEHEEYEEPHFAKGSVTFVVAKEPKIDTGDKGTDMVILNNKDSALDEGAFFVFRCQYKEAMTCGLKMNGILIDNIRFVHSFLWLNEHSHNEEVDTSHITLTNFNASDVGKWQCSCNIDSKNVTMDSEGIWLSITGPPTAPDIISGNRVVKEIMIKKASDIPDLSCITRGGNPGATLKWWMNGIKVHVPQKNIDLGNHSYTTVSHWNSTLPLNQTNNFVVIQCIATHPNYDAKFHLAEVYVTLAKIPEDPVILYYQKQVVQQPLNITLSDLNGLKCICANGNPVPSLVWQVNSSPLSSSYVNHFIRRGLYTAELQWDAYNNRYLVNGPVTLMCVANHPNFYNNHKTVLRFILTSSGPAITNQSRSNLQPFWAGIITSSVLLLLAITIVLIYSRFRKRIPGEESESTISVIRKRLLSRFRRSRIQTEEPLIQYSNLEYSNLDDQCGESEAIIICDNDKE